MMAAAQPFISGAISKTINMPSNSTVSEIKDAYDLSFSTMIKACAVYRDCSKLSQPLMNQLVDSSALEEDDDEETIVVQKMVEQVVEVLPIPTPKAQPLAEAMVHDYIATRRPLPDSCQGGRMKAKV